MKPGYFLSSLNAINGMHIDIHQDYIGGMVFYCPDRLLAIGAFGHYPDARFPAKNEDPGLPQAAVVIGWLPGSFDYVFELMQPTKNTR
jgi:hypothetical protein